MQKRAEWTAEDWAREGYVLITLRERSGVEDPVYIKRRFRSQVITKHESGQLLQAAKRQHVQNVRRRNIEYIRFRDVNERAMAPYKEYARSRREQQRCIDVGHGNVTLNEMTFFDLL